MALPFRELRPGRRVSSSEQSALIGASFEPRPAEPKGQVRTSNSLSTSRKVTIRNEDISECASRAIDFSSIEVPAFLLSCLHRSAIDHSLLCSLPLTWTYSADLTFVSTAAH
jgi:hypothetical protein